MAIATKAQLRISRPRYTTILKYPINHTTYQDTYPYLWIQVVDFSSWQFRTLSVNMVVMWVTTWDFGPCQQQESGERQKNWHLLFYTRAAATIGRIAASCYCIVCLKDTTKIASIGKRDLALSTKSQKCEYTSGPNRGLERTGAA